MAGPTLAIDELSVDFAQARGCTRRVVDGASLAIEPGEVVALVGESGSGKTLLARSALRLLPPGATITGGRCIAFAAGRA